jgi:hypothetical protein
MDEWLSFAVGGAALGWSFNGPVKRPVVGSGSTSLEDRYADGA